MSDLKMTAWNLGSNVGQFIKKCD